MTFIREFNNLALWVQLVILLMVVIVSVAMVKKIGESFSIATPRAWAPYLKLGRDIVIALPVSFLVINWCWRLPLLSMPGEWSLAARVAFIILTLAIVNFETRRLP